MKLIDKSKLLEELKKLKQNLSASPIVVIEDVESLVESLEVKEVDLEKEIQYHVKNCLDVKFPTTDIEQIKKDVAYTARMFFELGLRAQKGE